MLLAIDIGNTQIAAGLFKDDNLVAHWRLASSINRTEDETWITMKAIADSLGYDIMKSTGVSISSVVPTMTATFDKLSKKYLNLDPLIISHQTLHNIVLDYENPVNVGADRICNAEAGYEKYKAALIIVDLGTATTFDVIDSKGTYLGGVIAPGIESSSSILHEKAARLPKVELDFPASVIGRSTEASMQSGIMYGAVEMVKGFISRINQELGHSHILLITGGLGKFIMNKLDDEYILEPFLTLEGLKILYKNRK